ncbi:MAG: Rpn family recombination-promoting nuclease/putative transposase, partial [Synergistaceae bacterium]|nr:Rpn family recombination-promoting nuclease/putative transposase [Synergistaceae bacterium]
RYIQIIRAFLIVALDIPAEEYESLEIIDPHLERDSPDDKLGILDVRVQLKNKKLISVEIQVRTLPFMAKRAAFSTGRNLARQIAPGQSYAGIAKVVTIIIADYRIIDVDEHYHHKFKLYDPDKGVLFMDVMEIHTLELGKLPESSGSDEKESELLDWLRLIKSESEEEIEMLAMKTKEMNMTVGRLKQLSTDERTRMLWEARELYLMDEATRLKAAVTEGEARGEGRGKAKGVAECKLEMAKRMLLRGFEIETISQISELSVEDIGKLKVND